MKEAGVVLAVFITLAACMSSLTCGDARETVASVKSPDGLMSCAVIRSKSIDIEIIRSGKKTLTLRGIQIVNTNGVIPSDQTKVRSEGTDFINRSVRPVISVKRSMMRDRYNALKLSLGEEARMEIRVYDGSVAYRFETLQDGTAIIEDENLEVCFESDPDLIYQRESSFDSSREGLYERKRLSDIDDDLPIPVPAIAVIRDGTSIVIAESDRRSYPGLWMKKNSARTLRADFPRVVSEPCKYDRKPEREKYIATTGGKRKFPWRILSFHVKNTSIPDDQIVELLASNGDKFGFGWVKPGKASWDWWNLHNITGADFKAGFNTQTYMHYIDFAGRYGLRYVLMDEGWSDRKDVMKPVEAIDIGRLIRYANKKGVGIILWVDWKRLDTDSDRIMRKYRSWGIRGIKVDFMNRDDQSMTDFFWRTAEKAASNELIVDFHGAAPPPGIAAVFPNVLTGEGVKGLEHNKFSDECGPDNDAYIPFLRMFSGAVDYTPGALRNFNKKDFRVSYDDPGSIGTRVHQMALYTVLESPLSMMADSPSRYIRDDECTRFISTVPVTWDETVVCDAEIGRKICIARRKGREWFIGAITNSDDADITVDLSFLDKGKRYNAEIFSDGINAERNAEDYRKENSVASKDSVLKIHLAPGGGWTCRLR